MKVKLIGDILKTRKMDFFEVYFLQSILFRWQLDESFLNRKI